MPLEEVDMNYRFHYFVGGITDKTSLRQMPSASIIIYRFITLQMHWICKSVCNSSIFQLLNSSKRTFYTAFHMLNICMLAFHFSHIGLANELIKSLKTKTSNL